MRAPTKNELQRLADREVLGYEICNSPYCGWKNVFFEGEEPVPQLISSLSPGQNLCPVCRDENHQPSRWPPLCSLGTYREVFPDEFVVKEPEPKKSDPILNYRMRVHHHFLATIRIFTPHTEMGQAVFFLTSCLGIVVALTGVPSMNFDAAWAVLVWLSCLGGIGAVIHLLPVFLGLVFRDWQAIQSYWKWLGCDPLFPSYVEQYRIYRYFRGSAVSRAQAKRIALDSRQFGRRYHRSLDQFGF